MDTGRKTNIFYRTLKYISAWRKKAHPLLIFLLRGVLLYLLWVIFYKYIRFSQEINIVYNFIVYHLTSSFLYATHFLFNILGFDSTINLGEYLGANSDYAKSIILEGRANIILERGCLGRNLMGLFAGFIIVYPGNWKSKLWFVPAGLGVIYILNVIRIASLALLLYYYPQSYHDYNHHDIFKYTVYFCIFLMWIFWIRKYAEDTFSFSTKDKEKTQSQKKQVKPVSESD